MSANEMVEGNQSDEVDRFVYFVEIPSLQEIASHQVALAMLYRDQSFKFCSRYDFFQKCDLEVESWTTPSVIKKMIKNSFEKIAEELRSWSYHFDDIFLYNGRRYPYKFRPGDINWCVWLPNGEIDYFKTAMKTLRSEELSEIQKFLIMCDYCMEDEIRKVSLDTLPPDFIARTNYDNEKILFYWINVLKNTLQEVPQFRNFASPETAMVRNLRSSARFANEYFWHRIGDVDQLAVAIECSIRCTNHLECAAVERLISAMSLDQQQRLLEHMPVEMLINFSLHSRSTRSAVWVWKYYKEVVPDEQFAGIIEKILKRWTSQGHSCPALFEIWETAYDHQRNFVFQTKSSTIIEMFLFGCNTSGNALEFVITFFRQISLEDRKKTIFELAPKVKRHSFELSSLNEILNVCLPHPDDRLAFIKSVIDSDKMKRHFLEFMCAGEFNKVDSLLDYYFGKDIEGARAYKIKLLDSMKFEGSSMIAFICDINEWEKLEAYIDEIFSIKPFHASIKKYQLIKSAITSKPYRDRFDRRCDVQETMKIVEQVFANEELKYIKRAFSRSFGESIKQWYFDWRIEEESDETYFRNIVDWCLGNDEEAILKFKKIVSVDDMFNRFFREMRELYTWRKIIYKDNLTKWLDHLDSLNRYLKWHLASDDQVKMFKLSKLSSSFEKVKIFRVISSEKDADSLEILLKWFFGDDGEQMRKFRSENFYF